MAEQLSACTVFFFVSHSEDAASTKAIIDRGFHENARLAIDVLDMVDIRERKLVWCDTHNGPILAV